MPEGFTEKFAAGLASYGDKPCIEFEGRWYPATTSRPMPIAIASALRDAGVADGAPVGLVVRNRPQHAAAIIGFLAAGRPVSMIYSFQSPESIGRDIEKLELSAIVADRDDWSDECHRRPPSVQAVRAWRSRLTAPRRGRRGLEHRDGSRQHVKAEPGWPFRF